nr:cytochrome C oxidase subunit 3 [Ipomoea batatas]
MVDPSPWPISGSLGALATTVGGVMYMHSFQGGATLLSLGLIFILYTMFVWWRDVLRESTFEGHHTKVVQLGPRYGFILFIVSEVMFFFALFRASSHSSLAPTVEIGGTLFSIICGIRQYLGHLTKEHHVGFEAAAWYWHFVDVVRLFPFVSIYWWQDLGPPEFVCKMSLQESQSTEPPGLRIRWDPWI